MRTPPSSTCTGIEFAVLGESELQAIHFAALEVLRRVGIRFFHQEALGILQDRGAVVSDGNLVRFPAGLVEDAIASAPSRIVMCDRSGDTAMLLEGRRTYFGPGSDCLGLVGPETGECRPFTRTDIADGYRLCDALPNMHFMMSIGIPSDVDPAVAYDTQMALMLEHTTKPIVFVTADRASCQRAIDMAAIVAGGFDALVEQQHIMLYSEPSSPLKQSETAVDKLLLMAECGLPVVHSPGPQMGATAPITMASGLAMSVAEILSGLVVHQAKRRGAPFVFGAGLHHMDMSSAQISYGSPEFQLTKAAIAELGRWYGLPTWGYAGCSDAKVLDEQAALEAMLSVLMAKLSAANLVHDVGYLESGRASCFELIVLTDELVTMTDHIMQGIQVDDDTLMLDELANVGPDGHFLYTEETVKRFRGFWFPSLLDRRLRQTWLEDGGTTLGQRLSAKVKSIIDKHHCEPLEEDKKRGLEAVLWRQRQRMQDT